MAPETKKRKGAVDSAPKPKKQKKVDDAATAAKSSAKALKAAVAPIDDLAIKVKATRKRAADFFDDAQQAEPTEDKVDKKEKKSKKAKVVENTDEGADAPEPTVKSKKTKKAKAVEEKTVTEQPTVKTKRSKKEVAASNDGAEALEPVEKPKKAKKTKTVEDETLAEEPTVKAKKSKKETVSDEVAEPSAPIEKKSKSKSTNKQKVASPEPVDNEEGDVEDEDDQTAALLAGFESDRDESDLEKEDDGEIVPTGIPKAAKKSLAKLSRTEPDEPGVIYIGRIPHGFYEPQMKAYFKQFGEVNKLRLSRNKKTGASKHYAFVEFASSDVAEIVAKTMNNYLMFGHILQCKVIPTEQVHEELFKGSNQRFKHVPRNTMAALQLERGAEREVWEKRIQKQNRKRSKEAKILKEQLGYEYTVPKLKGVDEVPKKGAESLDGVTQQLLLEAPTEVVLTQEAAKPRKSKRTKTKA